MLCLPNCPIELFRIELFLEFREFFEFIDLVRSDMSCYLQINVDVNLWNTDLSYADIFEYDKSKIIHVFLIIG